MRFRRQSSRSVEAPTTPAETGEIAPRLGTWSRRSGGQTRGYLASFRKARAIDDNRGRGLRTAHVDSGRTAPTGPCGREGWSALRKRTLTFENAAPGPRVTDKSRHANIMARTVATAAAATPDQRRRTTQNEPQSPAPAAARSKGLG